MLDPLCIWSPALKNLRILEDCAAKLQTIATEPTQDERRACKEEQLRATLDVSEGIQRLWCADVQRCLSQCADKSLVAPFPRNAQPLNMNREDFWEQVFPDLFPFGDRREKNPRRKETTPVLDNKRWAKCLLS